MTHKDTVYCHDCKKDVPPGTHWCDPNSNHYLHKDEKCEHDKGDHWFSCARLASNCWCLKSESNTCPFCKPLESNTESKGKTSPTKDDVSFTLNEELRQLLNRKCRENNSDTPDHILADFMLDCLIAGEAMIAKREIWYGRFKKGSPTL